MAAAASVVLDVVPMTIEVDTGTVVKITKATANLKGLLRNGGANKIYMSFADPKDPSQTVTAPDTSDAAGNVSRNFGIDRTQVGGQDTPISRSMLTMQAIALTGNSVLYWFPFE